MPVWMLREKAEKRANNPQAASCIIVMISGRKVSRRKSRGCGCTPAPFTSDGNADHWERCGQFDQDIFQGSLLFKIGNRVGWKSDKGQCLRVNVGVKSKRQILKNIRVDNLKPIRYHCNRRVLPWKIICLQINCFLQKRRRNF